MCLPSISARCSFTRFFDRRFVATSQKESDESHEGHEGRESDEGHEGCIDSFEGLQLSGRGYGIENGRGVCSHREFFALAAAEIKKGKSFRVANMLEIDLKVTPATKRTPASKTVRAMPLKKLKAMVA